MSQGRTAFTLTRPSPPASVLGAAIEQSDCNLAAAVSHDLKSPLAVIKGRAQLLRRDLARRAAPDIGRLEDGLAQIERSAATMVAMLDELMDLPYTRSASAPAPDHRPTDLVALTRRVATESGPFHQIAPADATKAMARLGRAA